MTALYEIFGQVLILFAFAVVGFSLAKGGLVNPSHAGVLSKLLVYVFLPCNVFKTFATNFNLLNNFFLLNFSRLSEYGGTKTRKGRFFTGCISGAHTYSIFIAGAPINLPPFCFVVCHKYEYIVMSL